MKIEVTQDDINEGVPRECQDCPIALAIRRQCPDPTLAVGGAIVYMRNRHIALPRRAQSFISDFDDGAQVKPFSFDLEI